MPLILQPIITALIGVTLAVIGGFAGTPQSAVAPTERVPTLVQKIQTTLGPDAKTPAKTVQKTPVVAPTPKKETSPVDVKKIEKKIKTDIDALAQNLQNFTTPATTTPSAPEVSPVSVTDTVRASVVNIVCTTKSGGPLNSISASGVMIDSRGIIMTNSHVAQFFLLKDYPSPNFVSCIVRTGSPAYPRYMAELLYMPPSWMAKNAHKINDEHPMGNGEYDYAFLRITGPVGPDIQMPSAFPFLAISTDLPADHQSVLVAGYPAGFLGGITIATKLYQASAQAQVGNVYSFDGTTIDLFSVGGTVVAQQGSSGGAVTNANGVLVGLIVTATDAPDTASRDLRAIAMPYIISDFQKESGMSLGDFLNGDVVAEAQSFALSAFPTLKAQLVNAIEK